MTEMPMMECGHAANSVSDGEPACVICVGIHPGAKIVALEGPDLSGRKARCTCGSEPVASSTRLAFFEYRGPGSRFALEGCGRCGYALAAHGPEASVWNDGLTAVQRTGCPGFEARGGAEYDSYYDGCRGYD